LCISILLKLGLFPFIQWIPFIMSKITWVSCFFLVTLQKVNPFLVVCNCCRGTCVYLTFSVVSIFLCAILGVNQAYLRPLMAYSSVSHTGFLLILCSLGFFFVFFVYFFTYCLFIGLLFFKFKTNGLSKIVSVEGLKSWDQKVIRLLLIRVSGLPPFPFFFLKVFVFFVLYFFYSFISVVLIILSVFMSVYFYFMVIIPSYL